jgi:hypothetical protein
MSSQDTQRLHPQPTRLWVIAHLVPTQETPFKPLALAGRPVLASAGKFHVRPMRNESSRLSAK